MDLYSLIIAEFPELAEGDNFGIGGSIKLQDDGDGAYIAKWDYDKEIPNSLKKFVKK